MPYLPWPATNGGKARQHGLLRELAARGHRITLLALTKEAADPAAVAYLSGFLDRVIVVPRRSRTSPATLLRAALAPRRPAVATINGCNAEYSRRFAALLAEPPGWDLVQAEHSYAFEPLEAPLRDAGIPWVLTEHNVESQLTPLQYVRLPAPLRGLARLDRLRAEHWERRVLRGAACVVAVTPDDAAVFATFGARETALAPNCVDVAAFEAVRPDPAAQRLLFLGNFDYEPNRDAVRWLAEAIMPQVWATLPRARLRVHGHAMPGGWRQRWPDARIEWAGYAPDIAGAHAAASAFIAPLRTGGGSKLKVLEAMASGLPVVGTAQAMSGLDARPGRDYLGGAEDAAALAAAAVAALRDPVAAAAIGDNGRRMVAQGHDWSAAALALEAVWLRHAATERDGQHG